MAQLNDSIVRGILEGSGVTRWEVKQLCHRWLQTSTATPQPGAEALRELVQRAIAALTTHDQHDWALSDPTLVEDLNAVRQGRSDG